MFTFASPPVVALAWLGGLVVFYLVAVLLFRAGCALADVTDPPLGKTLLVVGAALALCLPVSGVLVYVLGSYDADPGRPLAFKARGVRFVRLTVTGTGQGLWASVAEFQVFGTRMVTAAQSGPKKVDERRHS